MSASNTAEMDRYPGFSSFKTLAPIHYPRRWMRTALIRATLAPAVVAMAPCPTGPHFPPEVDFSFIASTEAGFRYVLITDFTVRQLRLQDEVSFVTVNKAEVMAQPSAEVLRQIWTCSRVKLGIEDQIAVLGLLANCDKLSIEELIAALGGKSESSRLILAMVARGLLQLETDRPLTLSTRVWASTHQPVPRQIGPELEMWSRMAMA